MKGVLSAFILASALSSNVLAAELTSATSLKIKSVDGLTDVTKVSASVFVLCRYKAGFPFPESKNCGSKTIELKVENDGTINIPALEKFSGLRARNQSNYDISLNIKEGETWLATVAAYSKGIENFKFEGKTLNLYKINGAEFDVIKDGASIFGTDLTNDEVATLSVSFSEEKKYDLDRPLVSSSFGGFIGGWSRENKNPYPGKGLLKDAKSVVIKPTVYASFNEVGTEKITGNISYSKTVNYAQKAIYSNVYNLELSPTMVEDLKVLELK